MATPDDPKITVRPVRPARRTHTGDVCQRHGMHKTLTHGGRSWRCRR
jgi:hypothetical protein